MNDDQCWRKVKDMSRPALLQLWSAVQQRSTGALGWEEGKAFESLIVRAFALDIDTASEVVVPSLHCRSPYQGSDHDTHQIDGVVHSRYGSFLLECKDEVKSQNIEPIAKLRFHLECRPPGTMGMLFSTSGFAEAARYFAYHLRPLNILLWDRLDIERGLEEQGGMLTVARDKVRRAIEHGEPLCTEWAPRGKVRKSRGE